MNRTVLFLIGLFLISFYIDRLSFYIVLVYKAFLWLKCLAFQPFCSVNIRLFNQQLPHQGQCSEL